MRIITIRITKSDLTTSHGSPVTEIVHIGCVSYADAEEAVKRYANAMSDGYGVTNYQMEERLRGELHLTPAFKDAIQAEKPKE